LSASSNRSKVDRLFRKINSESNILLGFFVAISSEDRVLCGIHSEEEIKKYVNAKVAPYKAIREIEIRKELPMTPVGKVLRRTLRDEEQQKERKQQKKP
jgi:acyl-coenzyme A synthetase/AMP-(fatty) acid ligase